MPRDTKSVGDSRTKTQNAVGRASASPARNVLFSAASLTSDDGVVLKLKLSRRWPKLRGSSKMRCSLYLRKLGSDPKREDRKAADKA